MKKLSFLLFFFATLCVSCTHHAPKGPARIQDLILDFCMDCQTVQDMEKFEAAHGGVKISCDDGGSTMYIHYKRPSYFGRFAMTEYSRDFDEKKGECIDSLYRCTLYYVEDAYEWHLNMNNCSETHFFESGYPTDKQAPFKQQDFILLYNHYTNLITTRLGTPPRNDLFYDASSPNDDDKHKRKEWFASSDGTPCKGAVYTMNLDATESSNFFILKKEWVNNPETLYFKQGRWLKNPEGHGYKKPDIDLNLRPGYGWITSKSTSCK